MHSSFEEYMANGDSSGWHLPTSWQVSLRLSPSIMNTGGGGLSPASNSPGTICHCLTVSWTVHKWIRSGIVHDEFTKVLPVWGGFGKVGHVWGSRGVLQTFE